VNVKFFLKYPDLQSQQSAITVVAECLLHISQTPTNRKQGVLDSFDRNPLWPLIHVVDSPLQQFDQQSLAQFNQTVSKIGHNLKTAFYDLKSQGPLKLAKNIAEM
jgi:hypothetical protein